MVSKDGRTAGHFSSVGEVSRALVPMFLVIDSLVGLKATSSGMCRTVVSFICEILTPAIVIINLLSMKSYHK